MTTDQVIASVVDPAAMHAAVLRELDAIHQQITRMESKLDTLVPQSATDTQRISTLEDEVRSMRTTARAAIYTAVAAILAAVVQLGIGWLINVR